LHTRVEVQKKKEQTEVKTARRLREESVQARKQAGGKGVPLKKKGGHNGVPAGPKLVTRRDGTMKSPACLTKRGSAGQEVPLMWRGGKKKGPTPAEENEGIKGSRFNRKSQKKGAFTA